MEVSKLICVLQFFTKRLHFPLVGDGNATARVLLRRARGSARWCVWGPAPSPLVVCVDCEQTLALTSVRQSASRCTRRPGAARQLQSLGSRACSVLRPCCQSAAGDSPAASRNLGSSRRGFLSTLRQAGAQIASTTHCPSQKALFARTPPSHSPRSRSDASLYPILAAPFLRKRSKLSGPVPDCDLTACSIIPLQASPPFPLTSSDADALSKLAATLYSHHSPFRQGVRVPRHLCSVALQCSTPSRVLPPCRARQTAETA